MPRSSLTRLALASEKPGTCTGPPRLSFPRGAEQEARVSPFVPTGYLALYEAIERVAFIMHGNEFVPPALVTCPHYLVSQHESSGC